MLVGGPNTLLSFVSCHCDATLLECWQLLMVQENYFINQQLITKSSLICSQSLNLIFLL